MKTESWRFARARHDIERARMGGGGEKNQGWKEKPEESVRKQEAMRGMSRDRSSSGDGLKE